MTTNKQLRALAEKAESGHWYEVGELRYHDDRSGEAHGLHHDEDGFIAAANPATILALLADYEALQAESERLREHLQNLIDQTTPLEPVPGNPMWSRRIQLDDVMAERDSLRSECGALASRLGAVIAELQAGFVSCARCGDQEDTATLDCMPELIAVRDAIAAHRKGEKV